MTAEAVRNPLEMRVRRLVRHAGIDPEREPAALDRLIGQAIDEYEEQSLRSGTRTVDDRRDVHRSIRDAVGRLGPLQKYLDDPQVEEIWIDEPSKVFVSRGGASELTSTVLDEGEVRDLVERMLRASGRRLDLSMPFVDASLQTGERLHVVIPDVTRRHWAINIRKHALKARGLDELAKAGMLTPAAAAFLRDAVRAGLNVLVSGATQAGKTTLLRAMLGAVPASERIVSAEEVFELDLDHRDVVAMQTRPPSIEGRGEITLRRLVREAMRMRPERIVIGEVRSAEAFDLLVALNAGVPGACTIHANSAREAVLKLCTLPLLAGENVTSSFVVPTVARSVDLVVHVVRERSGRRQVVEIAGVTGRVEGEHVEMSRLFEKRDGKLVAAGGEVPHADRFAELDAELPGRRGGRRWE